MTTVLRTRFYEFSTTFFVPVGFTANFKERSYKTLYSDVYNPPICSTRISKLTVISDAPLIIFVIFEFPQRGII